MIKICKCYKKYGGANFAIIVNKCKDCTRLFLVDIEARRRRVYRFQCPIRMFIIFGTIRRKLRKSDLPVKESRFGITFTFMKLEIRKVFLAPREEARSKKFRGGAFVFWQSTFDGNSDFHILHTQHIFIREVRTWG